LCVWRCWLGDNDTTEAKAKILRALDEGLIRSDGCADNQSHHEQQRAHSLAAFQVTPIVP
ncbi:MAG TPA: hypothetical protein VIL70_01255, partial [Chthoniobacterales bacterium]